MVACSSADACNQKTPEGVLSCYFAAIEKGDSEAILEIYWGASSFHLPSPIELSSFKILEKITHENDLDLCAGVHPDSCKEVPLWAKAGTVQFDVLEEFKSGEKGMYTYSTRLIDGQWFLVGHSGWDAPE